MKPKTTPHKPSFKVLFATFSPWHDGTRLPINGMIEPMMSFFLPKTREFTIIDEPHPGSDRVMPIVEAYVNGKLRRRRVFYLPIFWLYPFLIFRNSVGTRIPFKLRDFLTVLLFTVSKGERYQLFVGLESVNALAGVFLKKLGLVETVVYYVSDFSPSRYKAGWFNAIYLKLDQWAAGYADYIWDVSLAMMPARIEAGLDKKHADKLIHVPNALFPKQINYLPVVKIIPNSLMYAGTLGPENGPDLAIETLGLVVGKIPSATLHIYGGGDSDLLRLERLTEKLKLKDKVFFHGFFNDQVKLSQEIRKYSLGLAPYKATPGSPRWWADATKTRLYLAAGLPVVTTQVPPLGREIVEDGAGAVALDNKKDQAGAVIKILRSRRVYLDMRRNAIKRAKNNTWENTYSQAMEKMHLI